MKSKKPIVPFFVFLSTLVLGIVIIIISERLQQTKSVSVPKPKAESICGGGCDDRKVDNTFTKTCPDGTIVNCHQIKTFYLDPTGSVDGSGSPSCILCEDYFKPDGPCECPQPSNTPTNTPPVTNTPTPSNTPTNTPTSTPSHTPTPSNTPTGTPPPSNTPTNTPTSTPTPTTPNTPTPTATPIPSACGAPTCDNTTNPCQAGLTCIQANNGQNYCSKPDLQAACKISHTVSSCCNASTNAPTPTEIILVKNSPSPQATVAVATVPAAGSVPWFLILTPAVLLILGLLF